MVALQIDGATIGLIVTQIVGMILTLAGFWYQYHREVRQRQWDLEDRMSARKDLHGKIQEQINTSEKAYHEANDAKTLIAKIEDQRNKIQEKTIEAVDTMKTKTSDVEEVIEAIQDNTSRTAQAITKLTQSPVPVIPVDRRSDKK